MWGSMKEVYKIVIHKVMEVESLTRGKTGDEKKEIVVNFVASLINIPLIPDIIETPAKAYAIGKVVDLVVEKLNLFFDWEIPAAHSLEKTDVDNIADLIDVPTVRVMDTLTSIPDATLDEKFSALVSTKLGVKEDIWTPAIKFAMQWEGGKNFRKVGEPDKYEMINKADKGGPTNMGVTIPTLKAAFLQGVVSHEDINALTKEEAQEIYKVNYWERYGWGDLAGPVALCALDCSINHGGFAWILQRACAELGSDLIIDGKYGPKTREALIGFSKNKSAPLAAAIVQQRKVYYDKIIAGDPSQEANKNGWYNRVNAMAKAARVS